MGKKKDAPWYKDGLPFDCQGCGRCCRGPGGYVWITEEEARDIAGVLDISFEAFAKTYLRQVGMHLALVDAPNGDCIFLDEKGRCKVYENRPIQCKTFPWWPEVVADEESWEQEKENCPGIGKGEKRHSADKINSELKRNN
ncbi:MAG: YkgJ family cysteine cluster protein [Planctomycetes bacterium]|nr:YkgJ family cysteine cluster protein [Planctomycetota bacterium]